MNTVEQIKERLSITDVVGSYIKLDKAGINLKGKCPFHNEKTASFFVSPDRGSFKCFGCGEGGDIFTFVERFEGIDFIGALKILAEKAGVEIKKEDPKLKDERSRLYEVLETATFFFQKNLSEHKDALAYLEKRGVKAETINKFRLGFVKDEWRSLYDFLRNRGFSEVEMEKVGLIKKTDDAVYDRFRGRIIFPIFDHSGRPVAFSGRIFEDDGKSAKYLNSPETILFNKSKILYGYDKAKDKMREKRSVILVEGQMDLLMSHQIGFTNTVATSGTALTLDHLMILKRFSDKVIMAFDGDNAGISAAGKAAKMILSVGMEAKLINIDNNMDPADSILYAPENWEGKVDSSEHIVDFYLNIILNENKTPKEIVMDTQNRILPFIKDIPSKIEQAYFVSKVSSRINIPEEALWEELNKIQIDNNKSEDNLYKKADNSLSKDNKKIIIRNIIGLIWWQESLNLQNMDIGKARDKLRSVLGEEIFDKIAKVSDVRKNEIIFQTEILYQDKMNDIEKELEELFINLEKRSLNERRADILKSIKISKQKGNLEEEMEYLKIYNDLSKKLDLMN